MPVTALKARNGRHTARSARVPVARRSRESVTSPALTLTITIPITDQALSPQAERLIEAVRDLAEAGGQVQAGPVPAAELPAEPESGPEVRLLTASRRVLVDGRLLPLTRLEFELLQFLAGNRSRVFTRAELLSGVWGYDHAGVRTVDVHVRRLRLKLGPQNPLITTVYGVGYRLADGARVAVLPFD